MNTTSTFDLFNDLHQKYEIKAAREERNVFTAIHIIAQK